MGNIGPTLFSVLSWEWQNVQFPGSRCQIERLWPSGQVLSRVLDGVNTVFRILDSKQITDSHNGVRKVNQDAHQDSSQNGIEGNAVGKVGTH